MTYVQHSINTYGFATVADARADKNHESALADAKALRAQTLRRLETCPIEHDPRVGHLMINGKVRRYFINAQSETVYLKDGESIPNL